jgi:hypothetical protein
MYYDIPTYFVSIVVYLTCTIMLYFIKYKNVVRTVLFVNEFTEFSYSCYKGIRY